MSTRRFARRSAATTLCLAAALGHAQAPAEDGPRVTFEATSRSFVLSSREDVPPVLVESTNAEAVHTAALAFCDDVERVSGRKPALINTLGRATVSDVVIVGVAGESALIYRILLREKLTSVLAGKWESAVMLVVDDPLPGVKRALVIAGSDRRGAAYALFAISRRMGVSPWNWWADVPVAHHDLIAVSAALWSVREPSVQYRGIFLNDEDWGLRPWAAKGMDPQLGNIGPHTYERIFELLLRLHANALWPAMHPGSRAFNADAENARLADKWGIIMGSSHSEALLRNNVGEWNEKTDGPWNYQTNHNAIDAYWDKRLTANGKYENFYTVGMRGVHDGALEATGTREQKAQLVEQIMQSQQRLLAAHGLASAPQIIWLYKESLDLYRAGMHVPDDVALGYTDDNYGYIRQLPTLEEQKRKGGAGIYYHVSYWGAPHDYLWLCTTPPSLIREEMTKAFEHGARRYWVLNVGDLKPAEMDIDYFMQLAVDEPAMASVDQREFLKQWFGEQFGAADADAIANVMDRYYALNFIRKPEFMGFNGYNDGIKRTEFNPLAWGDQNRSRELAWKAVIAEERRLGATRNAQTLPAFFELVGYPVEAAAAQNDKFLAADRTYLDAAQGANPSADAAAAQAAYESIQRMTRQYDSLVNAKWNGMMSAAPRERQVFTMPATATAQKSTAPLPDSWAAGDACLGSTATEPTECNHTVSIAATHFVRKSDGTLAQWRTLKDLGISAGSIVYGHPGLLAESASKETSAWLEYSFRTSTSGDAQLEVEVLPTFPVDSQHGMSFGVTIDGHKIDAPQPPNAPEGRKNAATTWEQGVLQNFAAVRIPLGTLAAGEHTLRLNYVDPGVIFEHLVIRFAGAPPAYPVPPESLGTN